MRILIATVLLLLSTPSWSCPCHKMSGAIAFKQATSVFILQITSTNFIEIPEKGVSNYVTAKFQVLQILKGEIGQLKELRTEKARCEVPLVAGEVYVVFSTAKVSSDYELLDTCSGSRWLSTSTDERGVINIPGPKRWEFIK